MSNFAHIVQAWRGDAFAPELLAALHELPRDSLPLQQAVTPGSHVDDSQLTLRILSADERAQMLVIHIGVYFTEVVGSCGCGAEPMPQPMYCEWQLAIDKATAAASIELL